MTCVTCWVVPSIQAYQKTVSLTHIYQSKISTLIIHKILILLSILPLRFVERNYRFFRSLLLSCREGCTCERYGCYVMRTACKCQHPFSIIMWPSWLVTHRLMFSGYLKLDCMSCTWTVLEWSSFIINEKKHENPVWIYTKQTNQLIKIYTIKGWNFFHARIQNRKEGSSRKTF